MPYLLKIYRKSSIRVYEATIAHEGPDLPTPLAVQTTASRNGGLPLVGGGMVSFDPDDVAILETLPVESSGGPGVCYQCRSFDPPGPDEIRKAELAGATEQGRCLRWDLLKSPHDTCGDFVLSEFLAGESVMSDVIDPADLEE